MLGLMVAIRLVKRQSQRCGQNRADWQSTPFRKRPLNFVTDCSVSCAQKYAYKESGKGHRNQIGAVPGRIPPSGPGGYNYKQLAVRNYAQDTIQATHRPLDTHLRNTRE